VFIILSDMGRPPLMIISENGLSCQRERLTTLPF